MVIECRPLLQARQNCGKKTQSDNLGYKINIKRTITGGNFLRDIYLSKKCN